jgi:hypothetical protein
MRLGAIGAAFAAAAALAATGPARAVTYDSLAAFSYAGYNQGLGQCKLAAPSCIAVDAGRTGLGAAFDTSGGAPVITTFHSLGAFGLATFGVEPGAAIRGAMTLETTFGNAGGESWPEAVTVVLHNDVNVAGLANWGGALQTALGVTPAGPLNGAQLLAFGGGPVDAASDIAGSGLYGLLNSTVLNGGGQFVGFFTNDGNTPDANDIVAAAGVNIVRTDAGSNGWRYQISIPESFGDFRYITFLDQTMNDTPAFWQSTRGDGWDLAHLSVIADVPEPATAVLFGLAALAAGGLRRRR